MREVKIGHLYKHYKGNLYIVLDIVYDVNSNNDEDLKKVVIYQGLYGDHLKWSRSYDEFNDILDKDKYPNVTQKYRFEEVDEVYEK